MRSHALWRAICDHFLLSLTLDHAHVDVDDEEEIGLAEKCLKSDLELGCGDDVAGLAARLSLSLMIASNFKVINSYEVGFTWRVSNDCDHNDSGSSV